MKVGRVTEGHLIEVVDPAAARTWALEVPKDGPQARTTSMCRETLANIEDGLGALTAPDTARGEVVKRKLIGF